MDRYERQTDLSLAKTFLYKRNPSLEEMDLAISILEDMPNLGYKGKGILGDLKKRKQNLFG